MLSQRWMGVPDLQLPDLQRGPLGDFPAQSYRGSQWDGVPVAPSGNMLLNASAVGFPSLSVSPYPLAPVCTFWGHVSKGGPHQILISGSTSEGASPMRQIRSRRDEANTGPHAPPKMAAPCCHLGMWHLEMPEMATISPNFQDLAMS